MIIENTLKGSKKTDWGPRQKPVCSTKFRIKDDPLWERSDMRERVERQSDKNFKPRLNGTVWELDILRPGTVFPKVGGVRKDFIPKVKEQRDILYFH